MKKMILLLWATLALLHAITADGSFRPCSEISRELRFPCTCSLGPIEATLEGNPSIFVNCDHVVFQGDLPVFPYGAPVVSYTQKYAGHQSLPTQMFSSSGLPLRSVDFSGNSLRRLTDKLLQAVQTTLIELRLADNLLGDTLNPIFSTSEFRGLNQLRILDISGNSINAIEEGILEGCHNLQELYLDKNSLVAIPSSSINGPKSLKKLSLRRNRIVTISGNAFQGQRQLNQIDLSLNSINFIEGGAFAGLDQLMTLQLNHNGLSRFNSDVFEGAPGLSRLDLSQNFITEFPTIALKVFRELQYLNLSSNLIGSLNNGDLSSFVNLLELDLSRNNIGNIVPGTFLGLKQLRKLDIGVNSLRTIEDDAFEGLDNLQHLNLKDNNILLIPASALGRLPKLTFLQLDYNRIAALSGDILRSIADHVTTLVISKNVVREIPASTFRDFQQLRKLDLSRNLITVLNTDAFMGLENTLRILDLSQNKITSITSSFSLLKLQMLDLSENSFEISRNLFGALPNLKHLNMSHNGLIKNVPNNLLLKLPNLEVIDLSFCNLKVLLPDVFSKSNRLKEVNLQSNGIAEIMEGAFSTLSNLTKIDLSDNKISNIHQGSLINVMNMKELNLRGNQLTSFKGEFFNTGTSIEKLDISYNQLSYLFPSSFRIHPRLKRIVAGNNKFNFFPAELISNLQFLEFVDLSRNDLKSVEELDFSKLPRLRQLLLNNNKLELISEMAFHNSTQLQIIDLSHNQLERLGERTFEGLLRLEMLNLEDNSLTDLPETIFERARLQMLENINLKGNLFQSAPLKSLQKQYFFLNSVDLSFNKLTHIPADDSIMVNIKKIDLSFNPLTEESVKNVLEEPKTVRELNLAGTGVRELSKLETPFLLSLNVSFNNITTVRGNVFERTSLLEVLDVSHNKIDSVDSWNLVPNLQVLNISSNALESIPKDLLTGLTNLKVLSLADLPKCEKIDKNAFKLTPNLQILELFNYPKLGYVDIQGLLQNLPNIEELDIETKDATIGADQLQSVLHPRLKHLGLRGGRLKSISSGTLSGIKGEDVVIMLKNTSVTSLPPSLFFPVPRSSRVQLDVTGSQLTSLTPQMLVALDDRRGDLRVLGLESNPIVCDCGARALRRWLPSHMTLIRCTAPEHMKGRLLVEVGDDELTCDAPKKLTSPSPILKTRSPVQLVPKIAVTEPEIIWSVPPTTEKSKPPSPASSTTLNNDDTLIIGIVGGVVAFIAILIIVICIIRLRMGGDGYNTGGNVVNMGATGMGGSSCACSVKGAAPYSYYASTLPHKVATSAGAGYGRNGSYGGYSTMGRVPSYQGAQPQPYFIAFSQDDSNKIYNR